MYIEITLHKKILSTTEYIFIRLSFSCKNFFLLYFYISIFFLISIKNIKKIAKLQTKIVLTLDYIYIRISFSCKNFLKSLLFSMIFYFRKLENKKR